MDNKTTITAGDELGWGSQRSTLLIFGGIFMAAYLFNNVFAYPFLVKAPVVGAKFPFKPQWMVRMRYSFDARDVLYEGYTKVRPISTVFPRASWQELDRCD